MKPFHFIILLILLYSCSPAKQIGKSARENILNNAALETAHIGISVYDPVRKKYLYNYQGDKYFVPASNTKIPTCYAAMKYLGDSLVGIRYGFAQEPGTGDLLMISATGDPTLLHQDFKSQPVYQFLNHEVSAESKKLIMVRDTIAVERWGNGWSWNDYESSYMAERSVFPIYGNTIAISLNDTGIRFKPNLRKLDRFARFNTQIRFFDSLLNNSDMILVELEMRKAQPSFRIKRNIQYNIFQFEESKTVFRTVKFPFVTHEGFMGSQLLGDSLKTEFRYAFKTGDITRFTCSDCDRYYLTVKKWKPVYSQPTDSLLKPMMHESDNFFAEQSLLMASKEFLDVMNENRIIDTLLKTDFADLPQKPRWADGSGLSRYNLFTPQDMVAILSKMRDSFGMERIKTILPTGNEGTLRNYYVSDSTYIYAKTGTLSGVVALSGFLYTSENRLLIFSILVNNHRTDATEVRRSVEKFVKELRKS